MNQLTGLGMTPSFGGRETNIAWRLRFKKDIKHHIQHLVELLAAIFY